MSDTNLLWGKSTWSLLHTIAARINETSYKKLKHELHQLFIQICSNLPCPECARHAREFIKIVRLETIPTKQLFRSMLYQFHNNVNKRIGKPIHNMKTIVVYEKYNLSVTLQNFITFYAKRYNSSSLIVGSSSNEIARKKIANLVSVWIRKNWQHFN